MNFLSVSPPMCVFETDKPKCFRKFSFSSCPKRIKSLVVGIPALPCFSHKWCCGARVVSSSDGEGNRNSSRTFSNSARLGANDFLVQRFSDESGDETAQESSIQFGSRFSNFQEDPIVDKLRTQLGVIHPIPSPPINGNIVGLFVFFFFVGVFFDKIWTSRKTTKDAGVSAQLGVWPQVPTSFSLFLEKDLQRKESVEWVNMVLGKLWKVYRSGIENWIIGLLQPVIDDLEKPDYVDRVEVKQFSLGEDPLSVRNVERRTSRGVNDLQYQIGIRYTGGARMQLKLSLKFGFIPISIPVGVRDFDIDGELWVKLRLIPSEPWVGAVSWAFVSLPKIKLVLSMFRSFNLMAIPVLSMFLRKLLTEDLPRLFVRPKKIFLDIQKGKAVGPIVSDLKAEVGNHDYVGELSVTLVDARKLSYFFLGKTDPYVILRLGDQVIRSKKNSQTTVIGRPGEPIWNQDFHMLVANPRKQKLSIQVKDFIGFSDLTIGTGEVDLSSLEDTVPTDRIVALRGGWGVLRKSSFGEILVRLTYKAYVEDEEDGWIQKETVSGFYENKQERESSIGAESESFMDVLAALIASEEFQGIVATEAGSGKFTTPVPNESKTGSNNNNIAPEIYEPDTNGSEDPGGSALVWFAVITSILVIIAINTDGSSLFNP